MITIVHLFPKRSHVADAGLITVQSANCLLMTLSRCRTWRRRFAPEPQRP